MCTSSIGFLLALICCLCSAASRAEYEAALAAIDWEELRQDLQVVLTTSKDFWPADYGNYGPLMIRQAWHCAGSYRSFDGRGGCDGGRQRFDPERSWDDNTNLDKAKTILKPIKEKYGLGLSWGDLIISAANVAIESMGGPVLGFCAGRMDDDDGSASVLLGPTPEQEKAFPCPKQGACPYPLGANTIGLIYVNPEGPMGVPNPDLSASDVRQVFGRMDMNDWETVALIGGGHAFGKCHGACPAGAGPSPKEQPDNPWPGLCGSGKGKDTFTSGFEGAWTLTPIQWSNDYFVNLLRQSWSVTTGPGGHNQWKPASGLPLMMLTSDISLSRDSAYKNIATQFATNLSLLNHHFSHAWYKLTTRDMGPVTRCKGPFVPPAQPFQNPLPAPMPPVDVTPIKRQLLRALYTDVSLPADRLPGGGPYYGAYLVHLAYQCMTTFRHTDYQGGCNGARIRFDPQLSWSINAGLREVLDKLVDPLYAKFRFNMSYADLIILAANTALEVASGKPILFQGGRSDAADGQGSMLLQQNGNYSANADQIRSQAVLIGLTDREIVALSARSRSPQLMSRQGYTGSYTSDPSTLGNGYFQVLLQHTWKPVTNDWGKLQYQSQEDASLIMLPADLALIADPAFKAIATEYASSNAVFLNEFIGAWTKLTNIDLFH